ncbi:MAG: prepilin peptidase [Lachnospiraceae bacterium]|nr:prepilin peptidase [Lachnospiraceae bacterium]MBR2275507.1 prepilin peptidase [Lachnospiraceae bacterium]
MELRLILLLILSLIAAIMDIVSYKVSNYLILTGIISGLVFSTIASGMQGLFSSFTGLCIPLLSMFVFYRIGLFGAGDLKLFSMIGAIIGPKDIVAVMVMSFIAGAFIGLVKVLALERTKGLHKIRFAVPTFFGVLIYLGGFL